MISEIKKFNPLIYFTKVGAERDAKEWRNKGYPKAKVKKLPEPTKLFGFEYEIILGKERSIFDPEKR
tara:strand:- start:1807 stop:2007 length:201 start_codon:yes stop_codon:yes gene_type:complete